MLSSGPYYQVNGGDADWSGFELSSKCELPDRKYSVPAFNEASVKLRDRKDNVPSRPSSLIESSEQKDLKIFEIGNLGDSSRLLLSGCTSQSSSQADLLDTNSVASDTPKSPLPSSSSREILDVFSNRYYLSRVFIHCDHNDGLRLLSPFHAHLFVGIIGEQSVLMILDELLRKLNNPCHTAERPLAPAPDTRGCRGQ